MNNQFYMITLPIAIDQFRRGSLTAKGLLEIYLHIKIGKQGWVMTKTQKEICDELGISKSSFYNALSKLKAEGVINWSTPANTKFSISLCNGCNSDIDTNSTILDTNSTIMENQSTILDTNSTIMESQSTILDTNSTIMESQSRILENETPKPAPVKSSSNSPDLYSNSFQTLLISLSDDEREKFLNFCHEEASKLPTVPTLPKRWIEANAVELKAKWDDFCGTSDDKVYRQDNKFGAWANHPRLNEMWENIIKYGVMEYCVNNISDVTIRDFCQFVINSNELVQELDNVEITNV